MGIAERAQHINEVLADEYPDAHCELNFANALELTVATLLSAQTTDVRVNQVTPELFAAYPTAMDYATANEQDIQRIIRTLGLAPSKAKRLVGMGQKLVGDFDGEVPTSIEDLSSLPGVGRKTALVVRGNAFGLPGLAVDTHVKRVSSRLGLAQGTTELKIEKELCALLPEKEWTMFSHRLIFHGRRCCTAKKPACDACPVRKVCPFPAGMVES
ncbi:MAG: endonuclease III [Corynebacterium sp.]|uniref:endonuclease III n=1 Tax=Corynebacterium sp. TaxID=1720 RepID=UPI0017C39DCA|nr:endonuclease III [Corynebacterium sp.]NWO17825.1 endonuclease III [Corynebacterium sp.]